MAISNIFPIIHFKITLEVILKILKFMKIYIKFIIYKVEVINFFFINRFY